MSFNERGLEPCLPGHTGVRAWASRQGPRSPASSAPTRLCGLQKATPPFWSLIPPTLATDSLQSGLRGCAPSHANAPSLVVVPCHCPHSGENHGPANKTSPPAKLKDFWNILTGIMHTCMVPSNGSKTSCPGCCTSLTPHMASTASLLPLPHTQPSALGFGALGWTLLP